jgi:hypothetical protein
MVTRRDFLKSGCSLGLFAAIPVRVGTSLLAGAPGETFDAVADLCLPAGRRFAIAAGRRAQTVRPALLDCAQLLEELSRKWRRHRCMLAGLTQDSAAILVQTAAFDHGFQVVYSGSHDYAPDGCVHRLTADPSTLGALKDSFLSAPTGWPSVLGLRAHDFPPPRLSAPATVTFRTGPDPAMRTPGRLVSWVVAPI